MDLEKLEKISDYSIALMEEIEWDMKNLSEYSYEVAHTKLDGMNKKIDLARENWVNVDSLDNQVLEFRIILFKREVDNKITELNESFNNLSSDIGNIDSKYDELKKESNIDLLELSNIMDSLHNEVIRWKIKFMINDYSTSDWASIYNMDMIADEISNAKLKNIDVDDIEEMLFW